MVNNFVCVPSCPGEASTGCAPNIVGECIDFAGQSVCRVKACYQDLDCGSGYRCYGASCPTSGDAPSIPGGCFSAP